MGLAVGGVVVAVGGLAAPFVTGAAVFLAGAFAIVVMGRRQPAEAAAQT